MPQLARRFQCLRLTLWPATRPTWFEAPVGKHSDKPERFYDIVRAASYPPYGEAFQRKARPDFVNLFQQTLAVAP
jgi:hypothetical protein